MWLLHAFPGMTSNSMLQPCKSIVDHDVPAAKRAMYDAFHASLVAQDGPLSGMCSLQQDQQSAWLCIHLADMASDCGCSLIQSLAQHVLQVAVEDRQTETPNL